MKSPVQTDRLKVHQQIYSAIATTSALNRRRYPRLL